MTFDETLAQYHSVFIDTAPIIYYIEAHPQFGPLAKRLIETFQSGTLQAYSSAITLVEVLPKPVEIGNTALADQFTTFLRNGRNLRLVDVTVDIAEAAGKLRGQYPALRAMDAIQLAVALEVRAEAFVTNDLRLAQVKAIDVLVLKEYLP
jgi:predicted nucleic acid-binding protein